MVVASGCRVYNAGFNQNQNEENNINQEGNKMSAKGILICRDNSHAFQERTLNLDQAVKIGRSVARARVATNNAIFDCKVLSRNHALLWYSGGKFYLQDTKSSNGTFVNNQRLSATGLESPPKEVCSGDIVQFGVDVVESTKKVTHGCIVATLKLYLPDGKEAKASRTMSVASPADNVSLEDLYKLNQYVQEASRREKVLQGKLTHLQNLVENTKLATGQSWKALIDEDRLLVRVKTVESQLLACSKNLTEDKIQKELLRLEEEKEHYQVAAKEALHKIHLEKLEVTQKLAQLEARLNETEEECQSLHDVSKHAQTELQELAAKYTEAQRNLQFLENKLSEKEESSNEMAKWVKEKKDLLKKVEDQTKLVRCLKVKLRNCWLGDPLNIPELLAGLKFNMQTAIDMKLLGEVKKTKIGIHPIEAISDIIEELDAALTELHDIDAINDTNLTDAEQNLANTEGYDGKQLIIGNDEDVSSYDKSDKNELDESREYIVKPTSISSTTTTNTTTSFRRLRRQMRNQNPTSRRTLVNGAGPEDDESCSENNDDTSSVASDDTWIGFNDEASEKSVIEMKRVKEDESSEENTEENAQELEDQRVSDALRRQKLKAHYEDLKEVHYDRAYRPEEKFADVATAGDDDDSSDSMESPNESIAPPVESKDNKEDDDIERAENLQHDDENKAEHEDQKFPPRRQSDGDSKRGLDQLLSLFKQEEPEKQQKQKLEVRFANEDSSSPEREDEEEDDHLDGDYVKTLKPLGNSCQPREYVLRTLISSLESLRDEDDQEAQQVVRRELDQLRDWLVQETSENIVNKLKELYYRAKNENQRIQEVNEELVILKEKYNAISEEKSDLGKRYTTLKTQCDDLLSASYSVPIQYVAPIALIIVWMLLERIF